MLESTNSNLTQTLLYGCTLFDTGTNTLVLNATIDYILSTDRFEQPLFFSYEIYLILSDQLFFSFVFPDTLNFQCLMVIVIF